VPEVTFSEPRCGKRFPGPFLFDTLTKYLDHHRGPMPERLRDSSPEALNTMRISSRSSLAGLALAVFSAGCTTIAQVANLTEAQCNASFESRLASILTEQGEKDEVAATLAQRTYLKLTTAELGPRPFLVASPSGTDYTFFIQKKRNHCLLRLYGRRKGFVSYTNNLTYISTRELSGCTCQE
jgi:hypothetical protein